MRRCVAALCVALSALPAAQAGNCRGTIYLTFDTGHMDVAPLVADMLKRHAVRVTFFAANERTKQGDGSLGEHWADWWKARAAEGHEFASHTFDHVYWRADMPGADQRFRVRLQGGAGGVLAVEHVPAGIGAQAQPVGPLAHQAPEVAAGILVVLLVNHH